MGGLCERESHEPLSTNAYQACIDETSEDTDIWSSYGLSADPDPKTREARSEWPATRKRIDNWLLDSLFQSSFQKEWLNDQIADLGEQVKQDNHD